MTYDDLIGVPFEYGGRGPDKFDCYGLVKELLSREGQEIPDYISPSDGAKIMAIFHSEIRLWQECELKPGAVLLFRVPGNLHVGVYLGDDKFIHTWEASNGVVVERLMIWKTKLVGVYEFAEG